MLYKRPAGRAILGLVMFVKRIDSDKSSEWLTGCLLR